MSLNALRQGSHVKIGPSDFVILQKLSDNNWQLQNTATGEWCKFTEDELLDRYTRNELVFDRNVGDQPSGDHRSSAQLDHALFTYPQEVFVIAQNRVQYLMTTQRVVFHYGIELEGLKYNGPELGELRRRIGVGAKVELTFDPGDLGHVNVLDSQTGAYIHVAAVDQSYAQGLSFWQNKVIRRYAQRQLDARTDTVALAQAKAEIRALVERDFNRKSTRGRKRHARFMEDHRAAIIPVVVSAEIVGHTTDDAGEHPKPPDVAPAPRTPSPHHDPPGDDEILPVFEADLDLPRLSAAMMSAAAVEESR